MSLVYSKSFNELVNLLNCIELIVLRSIDVVYTHPLLQFILILPETQEIILKFIITYEGLFYPNMVMAER